MTNQLTPEQTDALKEIVTIGAGNAATALSQMIKKKVIIDVPKVNLISIEESADVFGGAETLVTTVYLQLLGDISGVILFSFKKDEANHLADMLQGFDIGKTRVLNTMAQSALKETTTILSGAYLNAMSKLLNMRLLVSSPGFAQDMAGAVVDAILAETSKEADYAIIMDTELSITSEKIMAYFFFIPDMESLDKIMEAMGVDI